MEYKELTVNLMAHPLAYGDNNYVGIKRQMGQSGLPMDFDQIDHMMVCLDAIVALASIA